jgi:hypothetical protein
VVEDFFSDLSTAFGSKLTFLVPLGVDQAFFHTDKTDGGEVVVEGT